MISVFLGKPDRELVEYHPKSFDSDFIIMVPQSKEWETIIEAVYGTNARRVIRYATKKEQDV